MSPTRSETSSEGTKTTPTSGGGSIQSGGQSTYPARGGSDLNPARGAWINPRTPSSIQRSD
eukprot:2194007-Prymnesium_polylepis.1